LRVFSVWMFLSRCAFVCVCVCFHTFVSEMSCSCAFKNFESVKRAQELALWVLLAVSYSELAF
jgi:hypothetical protein